MQTKYIHLTHTRTGGSVHCYREQVDLTIFDCGRPNKHGPTVIMVIYHISKSQRVQSIQRSHSYSYRRCVGMGKEISRRIKLVIPKDPEQNLVTEEDEQDELNGGRCIVS